MATKKKAAKRSAIDLAIDLLKVRTEKKTIDALEKTLTAALKDAMHSEGTREAGEYEISIARTLKVADPEIAGAWAKENNCVVPEKIDTSKAKEILRHTFDNPSKFGFAVVESERIVPKGGKDEE